MNSVTDFLKLSNELNKLPFLTDFFGQLSSLNVIKFLCTAAEIILRLLLNSLIYFLHKIQLYNKMIGKLYTISV